MQITTLEVHQPGSCCHEQTIPAQFSRKGLYTRHERAPRTPGRAERQALSVTFPGCPSTALQNPVTPRAVPFCNQAAPCQSRKLTALPPTPLAPTGSHPHAHWNPHQQMADPSRLSTHTKLVIRHSKTKRASWRCLPAENPGMRAGSLQPSGSHECI